MADEPSKNGANGTGQANIQDFIFMRELAEVYLLLDHLSGRSETSLSGAMTDEEIQEICQIAWPPDPNQPMTDAAKKASTLMKARDKLNRAAHPANGASIAFTLLVATTKSEFKTWLGSGQKDSNLDPTPQNVLPYSSWGGGPPSRNALARAAYPGLIGAARRFNFWYVIITIFLIVWLFVTSLVSWDVAVGQGFVRSLNGLKAEQTALQQKIASTTTSDQKIFSCGPYPLLAPERVRTYTTGAEFQYCNENRDLTTRVGAAQANLREWLDFWLWLLQPRNAVRRPPGEYAPSEQLFAPTLLDVLATAFLPWLYAFLGAGVAVLRSLCNKMKDSSLSPRDLPLAVGQLALGAVIGACIGLFTSSGSNSPGGTGLVGVAALAPAALSFVAGFGVEAVFVAMEGFIKRVFGITPPPGAPPSPPAAQGGAGQK